MCNEEAQRQFACKVFRLYNEETQKNGSIQHQRWTCSILPLLMHHWTGIRRFPRLAWALVDESYSARPAFHEISCPIYSTARLPFYGENRSAGISPDNGTFEGLSISSGIALCLSWPLRVFVATAEAVFLFF